MGSPLEPDKSARAETTQRILSLIDQWADRAATMPASGEPLDPQVIDELGRPPSETGRSLDELLAVIEAAGASGIYHPSGGHMSYIPNAGLFDAAAAEFLAAGLNRYTGVASAAPGFSAIEHGVVRWMCDLFDFGPAAAGLLLSGGSMANFTGVVTARTAMLADDFGTGVIYVTPHTHHSAAKAARLAGLRSDQIVTLAVDEDLRLDVDALRDRARSDRVDGRRPFLVIASGGTTDTGTIDPLPDISEVAREEEMWMHVDAAYGGFFNLTERGHERLRGIEKADSIALDPHKGLSIPFGNGALVVRDEARLVDAHQGRGAYLRDEDNFEGIRDIASLGPELSRPFRGLPVWLPLHLHGVAPFREALDVSLDLAEHAHRRLSSIEGIDARWSPDLSIVAFRFTEDSVGRAALEAVNADGHAHLSPTTIGGRFVLRLAILNRRTTSEHVDRAIDIIEKTIIG